MTQLNDDQLLQILKTPTQPKNNRTPSDEQLLEILKTNKPIKDLGGLPTIKVTGDPKSNLKGSRLEGGIIGAVNDIGGGLNQWDMALRDKLSSVSNSIFGTNFDTGREARVTKATNKVNDEYEAQRIASGRDGFDGARLLGNVAATLPAGALGAGRTLLGTTAKSGVLGMGIGGAGFAKDSDERKKNAIAGGVGGAAGGALGKLVGNGATKAINAYKNNMRAGAKEIIDEGTKHGVRTSVGDVGRNPFVQKTEVQLEQVPLLGTAGFRKAQQDEAKAAANKVTESLRKEMTDTDYKSLDKIQNAASNGNKNAIRIVDIVNKAGEDPSKTLQAAAEIKHWRGQQIASELYGRVSNLAGNKPIPATNTMKTIDDVLNDGSVTIPNEDLIRELTKIKSNWELPNNPQNFKELQAAKSRLGELVDEWGAAINPKPTSGLTKVRVAIEKDLEAFANTSANPRLTREYRRADGFYKDLMRSKDRTLAKAMDSNKPDEIYKNFIQAGKGDRAANFYQNLDPKGQAALRYEMANQALTKAINPSNDVFSPAKFAGEFERLNEPYQKLFKGNAKAEMDGFVKLMRHVERAGQYAENPATGNRVLFGAVLGNAVGLNPVVLKAATASAIAKVLFTTSAGRRILLASKDLPPNSPKLANLLKQAQKLAVTIGANIATQ